MLVRRPRDPHARTRPARHRRWSAVTLAAALVTAAFPAVVQAAQEPAEEPVSVWPAPRELTQRDDGFPLTPVVGLVTSEDADEATEREIRRVLREAGVRRIVPVHDGSRTPVTVWLGDGGRVLSELGVSGADALAAEGFVLAAGRDANGRGQVVLDGADADGTYYATRTFEQVVRARRGVDWVPGVEIRDWPAMTYRGLIEGFYGTPWSHEDRLALMDYLGAHRMNTFEYAPKDDPYHRERWREPYPEEELAKLGELVDRAVANRVDFTFALSPGLSICYSSQEDFEALIAKFEALYELGARSFNIPLDDIDYNTWHCDADVERFGTGPDAAGRAQAYLLNRVQREWVEAKGDVAPLQMVPTEYYNVAESPYKRELREMDEDIVVMWTGTAVVPERITVAEAEQARQVFGHEILIWDNYPVNDYAAGRLLLAPYSGRENGLSAQVSGVVSNPMNQAALSELALYSFAEFGWNDVDYDATESWTAATVELAGGDEELAAALREFADLSWYDGTLHRVQSPRLSEEIDGFRASWESGDRAEARARLAAVFDSYASAAGALEELPEPRARAEIAAWLEAAGHWLAAGGAAVEMLAAYDAGDRDAAWEQRSRVALLMERAMAVRDDKEPHSSTWPKIADGVLDVFLDEANRFVDEWLGVVGRPVAEVSLPTYQGYGPANMVDGDVDTYFWSSRASRVGDYVGVDLGAVTEIGRIEVLMGKPGSPDDYFREGVLEYSVDGETWTELLSASEAEVTAIAPEGTRARYVRYRATADGEGFWIVVREFAVATPELVSYAVEAVPPAREGSGAGLVVDGDLATAYVADRAAEPGEALVVTLSRARPVERVVVMQAPEAPAAATVQVRRQSGDWVSVGELSGGYASVEVGGEPVSAVRLVWAGGEQPTVHEVVPVLG
ncbi:N-acetyl-beta-hexosaminidase [Saccharomonospora glauca K62]|uniref:N-acetyl-beta-hexosaminidase n=1 Tax=Saccharomonospora glauca K62 TaxID=928724 RepID=I1D2M5_9PSEU|nr:N-acetyl-beta-hexosaminidase [Saccharomonospora glauca K62]